jgi:hypothetical protein
MRQKEKGMAKYWILFLLVMALIAAPRAAQAGTFQVGGCLKIANFLTIQTAVNAVPPGSTILVCPGIYREQVTIHQPLTLRGQAFNNQDRPTIALPPNGPSVNVTSAVFPAFSFAAQVLVQNVSPAGPVSLIDITVDGSGAPQNCVTSGLGLAGIFFTSGTSGSIDGVTTRNQENGGCGFGIFAENGGSSAQKIGIGNDSVHDFDDYGVFAASNQNPSTLAVTIGKNSITSIIGVGIFTAGVTGTVTGNVVTNVATGIMDGEFFFQSPGITISSNVIANVHNTTTGIAQGSGIDLREGDTASSNKLSNVTTAFLLEGGANANPGPILSGNATKNTKLVIEYGCTAHTHIGSNNFIDSRVAYDKAPAGNVIGGGGGNVIYDIDTIVTGSCP